MSAFKEIIFTRIAKKNVNYSKKVQFIERSFMGIKDENYYLNGDKLIKDNNVYYQIDWADYRNVSAVCWNDEIINVDISNGLYEGMEKAEEKAVKIAMEINKNLPKTEQIAYKKKWKRLING